MLTCIICNLYRNIKWLAFFKVRYSYCTDSLIQSIAIICITYIDSVILRNKSDIRIICMAYQSIMCYIAICINKFSCLITAWTVPLCICSQIKIDLRNKYNCVLFTVHFICCNYICVSCRYYSVCKSYILFSICLLLIRNTCHCTVSTDIYSGKSIILCCWSSKFCQSVDTVRNSYYKFLSWYKICCISIDCLLDTVCVYVLGDYVNVCLIVNSADSQVCFSVNAYFTWWSNRNCQQDMVIINFVSAYTPYIACGICCLCSIQWNIYKSFIADCLYI